MVSPYLSRPVRSLREALESGQAPPRRRPDPVEARPTEARPTEARPVEGLLGVTEAQAARPEVPPMAPGQPVTAVAGGAPVSSPGNGSSRGNA